MATKVIAGQAPKKLPPLVAKAKPAVVVNAPAKGPAKFRGPIVKPVSPSSPLAKPGSPGPPIAKSPVVIIAKAPIAKAPIVIIAKTPVAKAPIVIVAKSPIAKSPIAKSPIAKSPKAPILVIKAPAIKTPTAVKVPTVKALPKGPTIPTTGELAPAGGPIKLPIPAKTAKTARVVPDIVIPVVQEPIGIIEVIPQLPKRTDTQLNQLKIEDLRAILEEHKIPIVGFTRKADYINRYKKYMEGQPTPSPVRTIQVAPEPTGPTTKRLPVPGKARAITVKTIEPPESGLEYRDDDELNKMTIAALKGQLLEHEISLTNLKTKQQYIDRYKANMEVGETMPLPVEPTGGLRPTAKRPTLVLPTKQTGKQAKQAQAKFFAPGVIIQSPKKQIVKSITIPHERLKKTAKQEPDVPVNKATTPVAVQLHDMAALALNTLDPKRLTAGRVGKNDTKNFYTLDEMRLIADSLGISRSLTKNNLYDRIMYELQRAGQIEKDDE